MSTLSSANVTDVNLVLKERSHMRLCLNMLIFTHNLGNWLVRNAVLPTADQSASVCLSVTFRCFDHRNEDTIMRSSMSGSTMTLVSREVKFIRIFAGVTPASAVSYRS